MPDAKRLRVIYGGNVQGVGFRATTHHIAQRFAITGTVRNLPDGCVEVIVEGAGNHVDAFLSEVETQLRHRIETRDQNVAPPGGSFDRFRIVY